MTAGYYWLVLLEVYLCNVLGVSTSGICMQLLSALFKLVEEEVAFAAFEDIYIWTGPTDFVSFSKEVPSKA